MVWYESLIEGGNIGQSALWRDVNAGCSVRWKGWNIFCKKLSWKQILFSANISQILGRLSGQCTFLTSILTCRSNEVFFGIVHPLKKNNSFPFDKFFTLKTFICDAKDQNSLLNLGFNYGEQHIIVNILFCSNLQFHLLIRLRRHPWAELKVSFHRIL